VGESTTCQHIDLPGLGRRLAGCYKLRSTGYLREELLGELADVRPKKD